MNRRRDPDVRLSMILSENRFALFRIMLRPGALRRAVIPAS
jgi:hypothetical protein